MYQFKDPARITMVAVVCLALYMALELLRGLALLYELWTWPGYLDDGILRVSDVLAMASLLLLIVCVVAVGMWTYRASANAHAISDEMTITPGWAVGWYFVPIMNLVRPYQGMREIWLASHFRGNWHGEPAPGLLGWWWGLWLVTNILGNIAFRLSNPETFEAAMWIDFVASVLNVPLSLVLITILRRTARAQSYAIHDETFA